MLSDRFELGPHYLTLSAQPMTDGWVAFCSCGWRSAVSVNEVPDAELARAKTWTHETLISRHREHVRQAAPDP